MGITGIVKPIMVAHCTHCPTASVTWIENEAGKPPDLFFKGFPKHGRVVLSKEVILLACDRCAEQVDSILQDSIRSS